MLTRDELISLSATKLEDINYTDLKELTEFNLNPNMTLKETIESFFGHIKNPYCFLVNSTPVKISFQTNKTLDECLYNYFMKKEKLDNEKM